MNGLSIEKLNEINEIIDKEVTECRECVMNNKCLGSRCLFTNYATTGDYIKPNLVECNMMNVKLLINDLI